MSSLCYVLFSSSLCEKRVRDTQIYSLCVERESEGCTGLQAVRPGLQCWQRALGFQMYSCIKKKKKAQETCFRNNETSLLRQRSQTLLPLVRVGARPRAPEPAGDTVGGALVGRLHCSLFRSFLTTKRVRGRNSPLHA